MNRFIVRGLWAVGSPDGPSAALKLFEQGKADSAVGSFDVLAWPSL